MTKTLRRLFLPVLSLLLAAGAARANEYEQRAQRILAELGAPDASSATFEFASTLETAFLHVDLGLYTLYMSRADLEPRTDAAANFKRVALELLRLQEHFLGWTAASAEVPDQVRSDVEALRDWVDSWSERQLLAQAQKDEADLVPAFGADEETAAAVERFAEFMGKGGTLPLGREWPVPETIVLVENRRRFRDFMAFAGWIRPELQGIFWNENVKAWTNFFLDGRNFYATKYFGGEDDADGISMEERAKDALEQQIVQLATNALLDNYYGSRIPPALAGGLSINLVVDLFGECNTRVDGDLRERRTEAIEVFIPGAPTDGTFSKIEADSRWRVKHQGGNRFVDELKHAQREGDKEVRDRSLRNHAFALQDDSGTRETAVVAPFMGASTGSRALPPEDFFGDFEEFRRAYQTCFVYWLKTWAVERREDRSSEAFATLLLDLARGERSEDILKAFEKAYGAPLSSPELDPEALETRFLDWLPKGK